MERSPDHGVGRVRGLETRAVPRPGAFPAQSPDAAPFSPSTTPRGQTSPLSAAQPLPLRLGNHRGTLHLLRTVEREVVVPQAAIFPYFPAIWEYHAGFIPAASTCRGHADPFGTDLNRFRPSARTGPMLVRNRTDRATRTAASKGIASPVCPAHIAPLPKRPCPQAAVEPVRSPL